MIFRRYNVILFLILLIFISCDQLNILNYLETKKNQNKEKKEIKSNHFDSKSFIQNSIKKLSKQHTILKKTMIYNDKKDTLTATTPDWEKSLPFIKDLDIRGKKYIGQFETTKEVLKNGKHVWIYKQNKKDKVKEPLYQMYIEFFDKELIVSKISTHLFFVNILYAKKEIIEMKFTREGLLNNYSIKGGSKMLGQDTTVYEVKGIITVKNEL